jgi:predicted Zn-dependent protease
VVAAQPGGGGRGGGRGGGETPAAPGLDGFLRQCFGGEVPPVPPSSDGRAGAAFERVKEMARSGSSRVEAPTDEEIAEVARVTLQAMEEQCPVSTDAAGQARLTRIVGRILAARPAGSTKVYRWTLYRSDTVNAFMGPGGNGLVLEGILRALPGDDELGFVLAHEVAHGELGHVEEKIRSTKAGWVAGQKIQGMAGGRLGTDRMPELLAKLSTKVLTAVYDQEQEFEADRLGLALAWKAGFDPQGSIRALTSISGERERAPSHGMGRITYDIVNTHPPMAERLAYLRELIAKLR